MNQTKNKPDLEEWPGKVKMRLTCIWTLIQAWRVPDVDELFCWGISAWKRCDVPPRTSTRACKSSRFSAWKINFVKFRRLFTTARNMYICTQFETQMETEMRLHSLRSPRRSRNQKLLFLRSTILPVAKATPKLDCHSPNIHGELLFWTFFSKFLSLKLPWLRTLLSFLFEFSKKMKVKYT